MRILVLEEEPLVAVALQTDFEDAGAMVAWAKKPELAVALLSSHDFDLAIVDFVGDQPCAVLVDFLQKRNLPYVATSADPAADVDGAIACFDKPYACDDILKVAKRIAESRGDPRSISMVAPAASAIDPRSSQ